MSELIHRLLLTISIGWTLLHLSILQEIKLYVHIVWFSLFYAKQYQLSPPYSEDETTVNV